MKYILLYNINCIYPHKLEMDECGFRYLHDQFSMGFHKISYICDLCNF